MKPACPKSRFYMLHPYILPGKGLPLRGRLRQGKREEARNLSVSFADSSPWEGEPDRRGMDEAAAAGTSIVRETQPGETDGRAMHAPTVLMKCGGGKNLSVSFADSSPWEGEPRERTCRSGNVSPGEGGSPGPGNRGCRGCFGGRGRSWPPAVLPPGRRAGQCRSPAAPGRGGRWGR